jgi:hypothetical protein
MHFHANYVSTSVFGDGDYYQALFQAEQDADDTDSPYLSIQRQFEDQEDNLCYIETHDEKYCGHFLLRRLDFTPQKLSIELDRPRNNLVSVTFAMAAADIRFKKACRDPGRFEIASPRRFRHGTHAADSTRLFWGRPEASAGAFSLSSSEAALGGN